MRAIRCKVAPESQRMFTQDKVYPVHDTGPFGLGVDIVDDLGHVRSMSQSNLRFVVGHGPMDSPIFAYFEEVTDEPK